MDMGDEAGSSQAKPHKGWEPGKCIPQLEKAPRYLIKSNRVGEHTEFMKEHALIGKFLRASGPRKGISTSGSSTGGTPGGIMKSSSAPRASSQSSYTT
jgi:hypothetical protein